MSMLSMSTSDVPTSPTHMAEATTLHISHPAQAITQAPNSQPSQATQSTFDQTAIGANPFLSPSVTKIKPREFAGKHKLSTLLSKSNWQSWRDDIQLTFQVCDLLGYITGQLKCPDKVVDPIGKNNWQYNDSYIKKVIWD